MAKVIRCRSAAETNEKPTGHPLEGAIMRGVTDLEHKWLRGLSIKTHYQPAMGLSQIKEEVYPMAKLILWRNENEYICSECGCIVVPTEETTSCPECEVEFDEGEC